MNEEIVFEEHECRIGPHPWKRFLSYNLDKIVYQLVRGGSVQRRSCQGFKENGPERRSGKIIQIQ